MNSGVVSEIQNFQPRLTSEQLISDSQIYLDNQGKIKLAILSFSNLSFVEIKSPFEIQTLPPLNHLLGVVTGKTTSLYKSIEMKQDAESYIIIDQDFVFMDYKCKELKKETSTIFQFKGRVRIDEYLKYFTPSDPTHNFIFNEELRVAVFMKGSALMALDLNSFKSIFGKQEISQFKGPLIISRQKDNPDSTQVMIYNLVLTSNDTSYFYQLNFLTGIMKFEQTVKTGQSEVVKMDHNSELCLLAVVNKKGILQYLKDDYFFVERTIPFIFQDITSALFLGVDNVIIGNADGNIEYRKISPRSSKFKVYQFNKSPIKMIKTISKVRDNTQDTVFAALSESMILTLWSLENQELIKVINFPSDVFDVSYYY